MLRKQLSTLIATFFYVGYSPKAPGTMGSLAALPFAWLLWALPNSYAWLLFLLCLGFGIWAAEEMVRRTRVQDNQCIVIDEVLGIFLATSPLAYRHAAIPYYGLAFLLFRLFDIWKPGPIRWLDRRVKGGLGVVVDDLAAAVFALLVLLAVLGTVPGA